MAMDPVSFLQLYCNQNNLQLDFTPISEQRSPGTTFTFRCDFENINTTGSAPSKKRAKQVSARMMICKMVHNDMFDASDASRAKEVLDADLAKENKEMENKIQQAEGGETEHNPVSKLGELCSKKHWTTPTYHDNGQEGQPHERIFQVMCTLENLKHSTIGEGTNKKAARRSAAQKMLEFLREENHDLVDEVLDRLPSDTDKNSEGKAFVDCIKRSKNQQIEFGKSIYSQKIDSIVKQLAKSEEVWAYIREFTEGDPTMFCLEYLDTLALEKLEEILNRLAELGEFEARITRSHDQSYVCNISLRKDDCVFSSWYGKDVVKDVATQSAIRFVIKTFLDEMQLWVEN